MSAPPIINICEAITINADPGGLIERIIENVPEDMKHVLRKLESDAGSQFQDFFPTGEKPKPYETVTPERLTILTAAYESLPTGTQIKSDMKTFLENNGLWAPPAPQTAVPEPF